MSGFFCEAIAFECGKAVFTFTILASTARKQKYIATEAKIYTRVP
jgi:hypothetical protein